MKKLLVILLALLLAPVAATAETSHATIELKGGAVFVTADEAIIKEIKKWSETEVIPGETDTASTVKALSDRFGDKIQIESFATQEFAAAAGVKEVRLLLRDAILTGKIPPIEGLSLDEAMIVLAAFGFSAVPKRNFSSYTDRRRLRAMLEADTALVVFDGTGPFDEIRMYYRFKTGKEH